MSMALSYQPPPPPPPTTLNCKTSSSTSIAPALIRSQFPAKSNALFLQNNHGNLLSLNSSSPEKWRAQVSFFPAFLGKRKDVTTLKEELLEAIAPLDRGAEATPEDQQRVDQIARKLEAVNPTKEPLKSTLLNGKWELIYTTSKSILQTQRPKFLRSITNYQGINVDTLRAQNMETWPFFNQVTADLTPLNTRKVAVKFDFFKIAGLNIQRRQGESLRIENGRSILQGACLTRSQVQRTGSHGIGSSGDEKNWLL
ncbi:probable plastid-lipid-associated protein 4, chloroplastic isoform X1 [Syzygium oleosum]|uniref:probable plastid-lipid-associated protein 4, chloroplastic isoform X1 n=1 Tax=Syzygium oleosum TaxID=219896 RepID=UPI0024B8D19E|nr:probable plastid-lipid-associated protein 4, chloroplastic isoform X1 [Syzygium oleosum]